MAKKKRSADSNHIIVNRRARYEYDILAEFQAGVVLQGWEIKAIRAGRCSVTGGYVVIRDDQVSLLGLAIQPLQAASDRDSLDPERVRSLLLHKREMAKIKAQIEQKGWSCVLINLHFSKHLVKARIGVGRGKKLHDKRATEKERSIERRMRQRPDEA